METCPYRMTYGTSHAITHDQRHSVAETGAVDGLVTEAAVPHRRNRYAHPPRSSSRLKTTRSDQLLLTLPFTCGSAASNRGRATMGSWVATGGITWRTSPVHIRDFSPNRRPRPTKSVNARMDHRSCCSRTSREIRYRVAGAIWRCRPSGSALMPRWLMHWHRGATSTIPSSTCGSTQANSKTGRQLNCESHRV